MTDQEIAELERLMAAAAECRPGGDSRPLWAFLEMRDKMFPSLLTSLKEARAEVERVREGLQKLYHAYVNTLELGRDRITTLGGQCDTVEVMENGDPALVAARSLLKDLPHAG